MSEPLLQLTYISDIAPGLSREQIAAIHQQAERNNQQFQITGVLLVTSRHFLQLLEGPAKQVQARFAVIAADPRHQSVRLVSERLVQQRQFPRWQMGLKRLLDQDEHADLQAVIHLYGQQQQFSEQHADAIALLLKSL
ncbi:BLUF domain-containing protein [Alishewanella sp. BS5-314]|uniref:BLUF domain-containing protein n=1 Tax=Alishewanella sp. BS5-314 TaxID=2755587 RepID=UPI0021BBB69F|nr:BLUF domain-containing protein [Alishewanella sp. BS5-314]MCT8126256.1 BLUF domain-containing protein [Alishewanella sp. BS5-314]